MNKLLKLLLLGCLSASAQAGDLPLWELHGTNNHFVLLGSIHYLRPGDYPLPAAFDAAYREADILLMELDMDAINGLEALQTMETLGKDPTGKNLRDQIGSARYNEVTRRAAALGIPMSLLDDKEAWYAAIMVSQLRLLQMGFDPSWGIEARYSAMAAGDGKPIEGLETLNEQLGTMDSLSVDTQASFLLESLNDQDAAVQEMQDIVNAWRNGKPDELETAMLEGLGDLPELYQNLLVNRNKNWARQILQLDQTSSGKNYLIVVGSMHFSGKDSVQEMLKSAGITYTQLSE